MAGFIASPISMRPRYPTTIGPQSGLGNGLRAFWYCLNGVMYSAVPQLANFSQQTGCGEVPFAGTKSVEGMGYGRTTDGSAGSVPSNRLFKPTAQITVLAAGLMVNSAGFDYWFTCEGTNAGYGIYHSTSNGCHSFLRVGSAWADKGTNVSVGTAAQAGFTFDGTTFWSVGNGMQQISQAISGSITHDTTTGLYLCIKNDGTKVGNGLFNYFAVWDRALMPVELLEMYRNPWQVLTPRKNPFLFNQVAAAERLPRSLLINQSVNRASTF